jgi:glycosyltransferase involved in cell wall biosynthesis
LSDKPWLSILIPVYNVRPYLLQCIESIARQCTEPGIEIYLLDDASTDGSWQICLDLQNAYAPLVQVHRHAVNGGLSAARNTLLKHAKGEYIWFIDSDDMLSNGVLQRLRQIIAQHAPDIIGFDYRRGKYMPRLGFCGRSRVLLSDLDEICTGSFKSRKMYSWLKISRRSLWGHDLRFPPGCYFEDQATTPLLLLRARSFFHEPRPWIMYRVRDNGIMSSINNAKSHFDFKKHDDLANAMSTLRARQTVALKNPSPDMLFALAHFVAREYRKLAQRLVRAGMDDHAKSALVRYHDQMQENAQMPFAMLQKLYLRRGRIYDWYQLRRYCALAMRCKAG